MNEPDLLSELRSTPKYQRASELTRIKCERALLMILIRTGKRADELVGSDVLDYAAIRRGTDRKNREQLLWEVLAELGPLADEPATMRAAWAQAARSRRHTVEGLVARYEIPSSGVQELLVEYLRELQPGMDYGSLESAAYRLVRLFWREVLAINPAQENLQLSAEVAQEWRSRLAVTLDGRPRTDLSSTYFTIRAFYRDIAEWAHEAPERWAFWVAPCPLPRSESRQISKATRRQRARMQQRTRILAPLLPRFLQQAADTRDHSVELLRQTAAADHLETFTFDGVTYQREAPPSTGPARTRQWVRVIAAEAGAWVPAEVGQRLDVTGFELDGFWGWAVTNVLHETGLRIEELQELTQLSLRHYVVPATNTIVPLLHIVPSKTDTERLIPMSPDLVTTLVEVQRRARGNGATIPLSVRYDYSEREFSEPLPHLFARQLGPTQNVLSSTYINKVLRQIAHRANLTDSGTPVHFTTHDFRRLLATNLVNSGLPIHIVSSLLGHLSLETTRGYTAIFPERVIEAHQAFIERRRTTRPEAEMRQATPEEWADFESSFLQRKVALGECHRPYATPCVHEHACAKCRFLTVDPAQLQRIEDMTADAETRLKEARDKVWLGEVSALEDSLIHLRRRRSEARAARSST